MPTKISPQNIYIKGLYICLVVSNARDVPRFRIVVAARHKVEYIKPLYDLVLCMSKLNL